MLRQVPWKTHDELIQVHDWLYSDSKVDMQKGVNRILAWKARQNLPTAIESTLQFIQLRLRDCESSTISGEELRLTYSMAIVRLVNGSIDPMQNKARPLPVSVMAERINMPGWFVEIRHDATHGYLPSIGLLRDAANQVNLPVALAWIQETFWVPSLQVHHKPVMDEGKLCDIEKALQYYRKQCMASQLKNPKKMNEAPLRIRDNTMKRLLQIVSSADILEGLIPVLLDKGFLVPDDISMRSLLEDNRISNQLAYLWVPLLEALSEKYDDFGVSLMSAMLKRLNSPDEFMMNSNFDYLLTDRNIGSSQEGATQKSKSYILTIAYWFKYIITHDVAKEEEPIFADVYLDDIVEGCLRTPNYFTRIILQTIAEIEADEILSLKPIIDAIGRNLSASSNTIQNGYNLENNSIDIDMDGELQELNSQLICIRGQELDMGSSSAWNLYSNTEWTPTPIGCLPGGIIPCLDLPDK